MVHFQEIKREEKSRVIDRGYIVTLHDTTDTRYNVSVVFKINTKMKYVTRRLQTSLANR